MRFVFFITAVTLAAAVDPAKRLHAVIDSMQDLLITIEREEEDEKKNYDCFTEWCAEEKSSKEKEVEEMSLALEDLRVAADQSEATIAKLSYVIGKNKEDIKEVSASIEQAEGIRNDERHQYEKDRQINAMSVKQLSVAIGIVAKVNQVGFMQQNTRLNSPGESSFVLGVFQSLKKNLERNQGRSDKDEQNRQKLFERLMSDKSNLLRSLQDETERKSIALAEAQQKLTQSQNDDKTTGAAQEEATKYLEETRQSCALKEKQWIARQADRAKEKIAIQEAISYLQITFEEEEKAEGKAAQFLQIGHSSSSSPSVPSSNVDQAISSLSMLNTQIEQYSRDQFSGVKKKIIDLIAALEREQKEEKKKKVRCETTEERERASLNDKMEKMTQLESLIGRKEELTSTLTAGIQEVKSMMEETKKANEEAEELRKKEHEVFTKGEKERQLALRVLKQAKLVLKKFYETKDKTALTQMKGKPEEFAPNSSSRHDGESNIVLAMLDKISDDIARENREAEVVEKDSQAGFEKHQADAVKEFDERIEKITEMSTRRARTSVQVDDHKEDKSVLDEEIDSIRNQIRALTEECEEFLQTYDKREKARSFEIAQLKDAHGIFSHSSIAVRTGIN